MAKCFELHTSIKMDPKIRGVYEEIFKSNVLLNDDIIDEIELTDINLMLSYECYDTNLNNLLQPSHNIDCKSMDDLLIDMLNANFNWYEEDFSSYGLCERYVWS